MRPNFRYYSLSLLFVTFLSAVATIPTRADSISVIVSGSAFAGANAPGFDVQGGTFFAQSRPPDGAGTLGFGTVGVSMDYGFGVTAYPGPGYSDGAVGGIQTSWIVNGLGFSGSFTVPASALVTASFTAPMDVSGYLEAYQYIPGVGPGALLGTLGFSGIGTATFDIEPIGGNQFVIDFASGTFNGTGIETTAAPEPASLILVGTGLAGLALAVRHRSRFA
jgi:hypothetical protein